MIEIPSSPNAFQQFIAKRLNADHRHILIVAADADVFTRLVSVAVHEDARICLSGPGASALSQVNKVVSTSESPWALETWGEEVEQHGPFDTIILADTQVWWDGNLDQLAGAIDLLESVDGRLWVQYLNSLNLDVNGMRFQAGAPGGFNLSVPIHGLKLMDLGSWLGFARQYGLVQRGFWALANQRAFEFFQKDQRAVRMRYAGEELVLKTAADVLSMGAFAHALEFSRIQPDRNYNTPEISLSPLNAMGLQGFLFPNPWKQYAPTRRLLAKKEILAFQDGAERTLVNEWVQLLALFESNESVRDVLLVGSGWGGLLKTLENHYPKWNWSGVDIEGDIIGWGQSAFPELADKVSTWTPGEPFPHEDDSFDLVVTLGWCSEHPMQQNIAAIKEIIRVSKRYVAHYEDFKGADRSFTQYYNDIPRAYSEQQVSAKPQQIKDEEGKETGFYALAIDLKAPADAVNGSEK